MEARPPMDLANIRFIRWYFNRSANPAKCWSVDFGFGTTELQTSNVISGGVSAHSVFIVETDRIGLTEDDPTAWFQADSVAIEISLSCITIRPIAPAATA